MFTGDSMKSINQEITNTIVIQKSKFICKLIPVSNIEELKTHLQNIKIEYPNATHYCYAYILGNEKRCSDDGEPNGTAGMPMLHVLEKQELQHILAVVIRYFGGIKLGAGGLVRAYSNSITEAVNQCAIIELVPGKLISCTFPYQYEKQIQYLLQDTNISGKSYQEEITYTIEISDSLLFQIKDALATFSKIIVLNSIYVKCDDNNK